MILLSSLFNIRNILTKYKKRYKKYVSLPYDISKKYYIKIIRKNDISRTNNVHNNKFQLNNKKKKVDSFSSMKLANKKNFQWTKTDFIKDLSISKDSNVNSHLRKWKKKRNSGIRVGRRLENPRAAA